MAQSIEIPKWPNDADVAVAITFDVDAECGWLGEGDSYQSRLTTLSEARFGVKRGIPRILPILQSYQVPATFYVPGDTAIRHREALQVLMDGPHEIGHHGHMHLRSDKVSASEQREEIERGIVALDKAFGVRPRGYRSASWEITPETFNLLAEYGFDYDSSCMGDDRPYMEESGAHKILEIPVHWSLDDWPYFSWTLEAGGSLASEQRVLSVWLAEFESALSERRLVTYTMHPEVIGRGYRAAMLETFLSTISSQANIWFATHSDIADHVGVIR